MREPCDARIARVAARQHAMIGVDQALALGLTYEGIRHRVRAGLWTRVHRGVFRVGPLTPLLGPEAAALLAIPDGRLIGFSATALWGVTKRPAQVHVLAPTRRRRRPGIVVHVGSIEPEDVTRRQNLAVPSAFRSLVELRGRAGAKAYRHAVWEAGYRGLVTDAEAVELTGMKPVKANHQGERELVYLVHQAGLPEPKTNQYLHGYEIDLYWPDHRVAVELDSERAHAHVQAVDRDDNKSRALERNGVALVRVGGAQLAEESFAVVASIAGALAAAGS